MFDEHEPAQDATYHDLSAVMLPSLLELQHVAVPITLESLLLSVFVDSKVFDLDKQIGKIGVDKRRCTYGRK